MSSQATSGSYETGQALFFSAGQSLASREPPVQGFPVVTMVCGWEPPTTNASVAVLAGTDQSHESLNMVWLFQIRTSLVR